jgi:hypothetical protein
MKPKCPILSCQLNGKTLRFARQSAIGTGRLLHGIEPRQGDVMTLCTSKAAE